MLILAHRLDLKRVPAQGNHLGLPGSADVYITPSPPQRKMSLFFFNCIATLPTKVFLPDRTAQSLLQNCCCTQLLFEPSFQPK